MVCDYARQLDAPLVLFGTFVCGKKKVGSMRRGRIIEPMVSLGWQAERVLDSMYPRGTGNDKNGQISQLQSSTTMHLFLFPETPH